MELTLGLSLIDIAVISPMKCDIEEDAETGTTASCYSNKDEPDRKAISPIKKELIPAPFLCHLCR